MRFTASALLACGAALLGGCGHTPGYPPNPILRPTAVTDFATLYSQNCAACHGANGRGHGPASLALKHAVPDLTLISQRNGGKFPAQRVKEIIEGKPTAPPAHGDREMPIWGPIFHQIEADQDWGEVRLDAITRQVESIQQK